MSVVDVDRVNQTIQFRRYLFSFKINIVPNLKFEIALTFPALDEGNILTGQFVDQLKRLDNYSSRLIFSHILIHDGA